jgi:hypothetical protein
VEILYLLIPLSAVLVLGILAVFGWAVNRANLRTLKVKVNVSLQRTPRHLTPIK